MDAEIQSVLVQTQCRYVDLAKRDMLGALQIFNDLRPAKEMFVSPNGSQRTHAVLSGTIPVTFRGSVYNIPICVYLMDTHPYNSPMCYVRPTPDMTVKVSQHVDQTGRVYLPYITEWRHPHSDLVGLLQVMAIVFGEVPPVFAKPTGGSSSGGATGYSPYPAYPQNPSPYMPMPQLPGSVQSGTGYGFGQDSTPTPYPSRPAPAPPTTGNSQYPPYPTSYSAAGYPPPTGTARPPYPMPTPINSANVSKGSYGTITDEHIRASLLSSVEDSLRRKMREAIGTAHAELQVVKNTRDELNKGKVKLEDIRNKIDSEQRELESIMATCQQKSAEMQKVIDSLPKDSELNVDEAIDTTAPVYRQLLSCYVKDLVIDDTIYTLSQALKQGRLDLTQYLQHVRELSRKQFRQRAKMLKCRSVAGLPVEL